MLQADKHEIEEKWIRLLRDGNHLALAQVFNHYHSRLFSFCFRFVKSRDLADEMVQRTFIKVWDARESLMADTSFSSFLFQIAKNYTIDHLRKVTRDEELLHEFSARVMSFSNETEESLVYAELVEKIRHSIEKLPPQRQKIFKMSREQGLSHEEISSILGISKNTVKVSIFKSLQEIRHQLSEYDLYLILCLCCLHIK